MRFLSQAAVCGVMGVVLVAGAPGSAVGEPRDAVAEPGEIQTAEQLLVALERVDDTVETLQADIQYDRRFRLQGDQHVRRGKLYYRATRGATNDARPTRAFEIDFLDLWLVMAARKEADRQVWVFDGRWLIEKRPDKKQFVAREIAGPGEDFDPLSIKEGIMPIPIGQRAADVLERFDVEMVDPQFGIEDEPEALTSFTSGCFQLRLVPREEFAEDSKFREIRLWYEKDDLTPRMSRAVDQKGDVSFVQLLNVERNGGLPEGVMVVTPPPVDAGWDVQIEETPVSDRRRLSISASGVVDGSRHVVGLGNELRGCGCRKAPGLSIRRGRRCRLPI